MAEILVKAVSVSHADPDKDRRGCYKKGYPVVVRPDGHEWGSKECLPSFTLIRIPMISVAKVQKYVDPEMDAVEPDLIYRRRLWTIRHADLPAAAIARLFTDGELIIKASPAYTDAYDYTWAQVKAFFRNQKTGLDEVEDL